MTLSLDIPPFDVLCGQETPYQGFGRILADSSTRDTQVLGLADAAWCKVESHFGITVSEWNQVPAALDECITNMWNEGWNPVTGNLNLFVADFGLVVSLCVLNMYNGSPVHRSTTDLNHMSIWWEKAQVEVFPFHKTLKRLVRPSEESLDLFVRGLCHLLRPEMEN